MMVLNKPRPRNGIRKISIKTTIIIAYSQLLCRCTVSISTKHFHILADAFKPDIAIVGNMKFCAMAFLCRHNDNA